MVESKEDFIDISPEVGGSKGKKTTVFQETEWALILNNPQGWTKEGMEENLALWKQSSNKHVQILIQTMINRCPKDKIPSSGKTSDGKIILARNKDGVPTWVKDDPNYKPQPQKK